MAEDCGVWTQDARSARLSPVATNCVLVGSGAWSWVHSAPLLSSSRGFLPLLGVSPVPLVDLLLHLSLLCEGFSSGPDCLKLFSGPRPVLGQHPAQMGPSTGQKELSGGVMGIHITYLLLYLYRRWVPGTEGLNSRANLLVTTWRTGPNPGTHRGSRLGESGRWPLIDGASTLCSSPATPHSLRQAGAQMLKAPSNEETL